MIPIPSYLMTRYALDHGIAQLEAANDRLEARDDAALLKIARDTLLILELIAEDCEIRLEVVHSPEQLELTPLG